MDIIDKPSLPDPQKVSNWNLVIRYGAIWAISGFLMTIIGFLTNTDPGHPATSTVFKTIYFLAGIGIAIWAIRAAILADRDGQLGGFISMGRATGIGAKMGLICGGIGGILQIIYTQLINPGYQETVNRALQEQFAEQGLSEEQIESAIAMTASFTGPVALFISYIIVAVLIGTIIGLIAGAVLKKDPY